MPSRRGFLAAMGGAILAGPALAAPARRVTVEDWSSAPRGHHGIPPGWEAYETPGGHPAYDFTVVEDDGRPALSLRSADDHSTIARRLEVDLDATPVLEWSWKAVRLPAGADVRRREASDLVADVLVTWPRFPALVRSQLIGYAWDAVTPEGAVVRSPKTSTVTFVIVRSGAGSAGRWVTERRNVAEDYRRIYGSKPANPTALALSIDSNDTHTVAEAMIGALAFTAS